MLAELQTAITQTLKAELPGLNYIANMPYESAHAPHKRQMMKLPAVVVSLQEIKSDHDDGLGNLQLGTTWKISVLTQYQKGGDNKEALQLTEQIALIIYQNRFQQNNVAPVTELSIEPTLLDDELSFSVTGFDIQFWQTIKLSRK